ncbi:MAG: hypothetical protein KYX60_15010 [Halomonas meridiana]|uniref:hypothetical protein n=1 Tax=Vreelandella aquamarina TaxID=77097 RepID=UPI0024E2748B|nr:hypothetical protein [Halomonas meridiana]MDK2751947.1 hypothetical protein [Halomonas meridiana]
MEALIGLCLLIFLLITGIPIAWAFAGALGYFAFTYDPALFTRALIERSEGTGCWHCLSGFASSARVAVE